MDVCVLISASYKSIDHLGPTLTTHFNLITSLKNVPPNNGPIQRSWGLESPKQLLKMHLSGPFYQ